MSNHIFPIALIFLLLQFSACTSTPDEKTDDQPSNTLQNDESSDTPSLSIGSGAVTGATSSAVTLSDTDNLSDRLEDLDLPLVLPKDSQILATMEVTLGESGDTVKVKKEITAALPSSALPSSALPSSALPSSIKAGALPSSALPSSALPSSYFLKSLRQGKDSSDNLEVPNDDLKDVKYLIKSFYLVLGPRGNLIGSPIRGNLSYDENKEEIIAHLKPEQFDPEGFPGGSKVLIVIVLMSKENAMVTLAGYLIDELPSIYTKDFTVRLGNTPPAVEQNLSITLNEGEDKNVTLGYTDIERQTVTITGRNLPSFVTLNKNSLIISSTFNDGGTYTFTLVYTDNGTPSLSSEQKVTLTVDKVNQAPTLVPLDDTVVYVGETLTVTIQPFDPDVEDRALLKMSLIGAPGFVRLDNYSLVISPTIADIGEYTFTLSVSDQNTPPLSAMATQKLIVTDQPSVAAMAQGFHLSWLHPQPTGAILNDIHGVSSTDVWAVGQAGTVLHYNGVKWQPESLDPLFDFSSVQAIGPNEALIGGTDDGNASSDLLVHCTVGSNIICRKIFSGEAASGISDLYATGTVAFATTYNNKIIKYSSQDFSQATSYQYLSAGAGLPPEAVRLDAIFGLSPSSVYVSGDFLTILHFDGVQWSTLATHNTFSGLTGLGSVAGTIWGSSDSDLYFGDSSTVHYDGSQWTSYFQDNGPVNAIAGAMGEQPYVGTDWGEIFVGRPAIPQYDTYAEIGASIPISGMYMAGDGNLFISGYHGLLMKRGIGATATFEVATTGIDGLYEYSSIWAADQNHLFITASDKPYVIGFDGATSIMNETPSPSLNLSDIYGRAANDVVAVGQVAWAVHFNGTDFRQVDLANCLTSQNLLAVHAFAGDTSSLPYWAAGGGGSLINFHVSGECDKVSLESTAALKAIHGISASDFYVVGTNAEIWQINAGIPTKIVIPENLSMDVPAGTDWSAVQTTSDGTVYLGGSNSSSSTSFIYRVDNSGWKRIFSEGGSSRFFRFAVDTSERLFFIYSTYSAGGSLSGGDLYYLPDAAATPVKLSAIYLLNLRDLFILGDKILLVGYGNSIIEGSGPLPFE